MAMKIIRAHRPKRFTVLDNASIEDIRLSFRALGVLTYLLSRPDGWQTDSTRLAATRKEGRDATRTALRELEAAGYLSRSRVQDPATGRWTTTAQVVDNPGSLPGDGFPGVGHPAVGLPGGTRNHPQKVRKERIKSGTSSGRSAPSAGQKYGTNDDDQPHASRLDFLAERLSEVDGTVDPSTVWRAMRADGIRHPDLWSHSREDVELCGWLNSVEA